MKTIRILHECEVLIGKSVPICRVMPNCDPRDRFVDQYPRKLMIDSFSCTPMGANAWFYSHLP